GKVISVDKTAKKAKIDHENIPGYMDAMTMDFPIREDTVWDELKPGSDIRAELVVDNANAAFWLENITISSAPAANQAPLPVNENVVRIGKEAPDFSLVNQDGKHISLKDFRGKALAITFIYRECPLPDYCIKMSKNFSDLANQLKNEPDAKDKMRLLSISFDPARDNPEKLRQYGLGYLGNDPKADFSIWQLAVGSDKQIRSIADFFGMSYQVDQDNKAQIDHSLVTAVISPEGKVAKIFTGNDWTPADLLQELKATLAK
ncbi:MAG: SCO family protein, partial [Pyrinomonadaceae bacterium]